MCNDSVTQVFRCNVCYFCPSFTIQYFNFNVVRSFFVVTISNHSHSNSNHLNSLSFIKSESCNSVSCFNNSTDCSISSTTNYTVSKFFSTVKICSTVKSISSQCVLHTFQEVAGYRVGYFYFSRKCQCTGSSSSCTAGFSKCSNFCYTYVLLTTVCLS